MKYKKTTISRIYTSWYNNILRGDILEEKLIKKWEAFNQLLIPVLIMNEDKECVFANRAVIRVYGYTPEELKNNNILNLLLLPEDIHNAKTLLEYNFLVYKGSRITRIQKTKSGKLIKADIEWNIQTIYNKQYAYLTINNVTPYNFQQKQVGQSNQNNNNQLYEFIINNSYTNFLVLDAYFNISYASPSFIQSHNNEVLGQNIFEYFLDDAINDPRFMKIKEMNENNNFLLIEQFDHRYHSSMHGDKFINIYCYYVNFNKEQKILVKIRDYTEVDFYKKNYQKLEKSTIDRDRLILLGEAIAGIAHEINNPLTTILTNAQMLQRKINNNEITRISKEAIRISKITKSLLSFSRHSQNIKGRVNIKEQFEDCILLLNTKISDEIKLNMDISEEINILGDYVEFSQIIINLLRNSIDAIENIKKKVIEIKAKVINDTVEITISDTGQGIPEKNLEKVFEPFFSTKKVGKGTGLGLSMVYYLVNKINGKITVSSQENVGTTFVLTLPLFKGLNRNGEEISFKNKKILILDDDKFFLDIVEDIFKQEGSYLVKEHDPIKGFQMIMENDYDLLLIDTEMPFLNGIEICKSLHSNNFDISKIIFMIETIDEDLREYFQKVKAKFIIKPFTLEDLKKCIFLNKIEVLYAINSR